MGLCMADCVVSLDDSWTSSNIIIKILCFIVISILNMVN